MRVIFMGSPEFSVPALRALHAAHQIVCVYAQPPKPAHRGQRETPCSVHLAALELGLPVRSPARVRRDAAEHRRDAPRVAVDREGAPVAGRAGGRARGRQRRPPSHGGNRVCAKPSEAMTLPTT